MFSKNTARDVSSNAKVDNVDYSSDVDNVDFSLDIDSEGLGSCDVQWVLQIRKRRPLLPPPKGEF